MSWSRGIGEWFALFYWLKFQMGGDLLLANVLLWTGFLVERTSVLLWLRYIHRSGTGIASKDTGFLKTAVAIVAICIPELIIWVGWLWLARSYGFWVAAQTRDSVKAEWVDLFMDLATPLCDAHLNLFGGESEPAEIQYVLR